MGCPFCELATLVAEVLSGQSERPTFYEVDLHESRGPLLVGVNPTSRHAALCGPPPRSVAVYEQRAGQLGAVLLLGMAGGGRGSGRAPALPVLEGALRAMVLEQGDDQALVRLVEITGRLDERLCRRGPRPEA